VHRSFAKSGVTKAIIDLVERETDRDTMLSSACVDTLEMIRKVPRGFSFTANIPGKHEGDHYRHV
jgi:hypothetical protein